jgi:hypothetical protein
MTARTDLDARKAPAERLVDDALPDVIACPDPTCRAPARIVDRWSWGSSDGPVEHVKTRCLHGHVFTPTADALTPLATATSTTPSRALEAGSAP